MFMQKLWYLANGWVWAFQKWSCFPGKSEILLAVPHVSDPPGSGSSGLTGRDGTGAVCAELPARAFPAMRMKRAPGSRWGQVRAAHFSPFALAFSSVRSVDAQQRVTTLVAQESRQMLVLSSWELHSLRYGFAPGFGRASFPLQITKMRGYM